MATSAATAAHILDALAGAGDVRARRMFGEYAVYFDNCKENLKLLKFTHHSLDIFHKNVFQISRNGIFQVKLLK